MKRDLVTRLIEEINKEAHKNASKQVSNGQLIRLPEVLNILGISKPTFYRRMKSGKYPRPVFPSDRTAAWYRSDIEAIVQGLRDAG